MSSVNNTSNTFLGNRNVMNNNPTSIYSEGMTQQYHNMRSTITSYSRLFGDLERIGVLNSDELNYLNTKMQDFQNKIKSYKDKVDAVMNDVNRISLDVQTAYRNTALAIEKARRTWNKISNFLRGPSRLAKDAKDKLNKMKQIFDLRRTIASARRFSLLSEHLQLKAVLGVANTVFNAQFSLLDPGGGSLGNYDNTLNNSNRNALSILGFTNPDSLPQIGNQIANYKGGKLSAGSDNAIHVRNETIVLTYIGKKNKKESIRGFIDVDSLDLSIVNKYEPLFGQGIFGQLGKALQQGKAIASVLTNSDNKAKFGKFDTNKPGGLATGLIDAISDTELSIGMSSSGYQGIVLNSPYIYQGSEPMKLTFAFKTIAKTKGDVWDQYYKILRAVSPNYGKETLLQIGGNIAPSTVSVKIWNSIELKNLFVNNVVCKVKSVFDKNNSPIIGVFTFTCTTDRMVTKERIDELFSTTRMKYNAGNIR